MSSADYQVALLLQRQCEQESNKNIDADHSLALLLQEQFNHDKLKQLSIQKDSQEERKNSPNNSKSLIDPSWELVDPTPNIHTLFVTFNQHFFWTKLLAVCVAWSKRMTSCAGICSYQGRGGMCTITLSEPLLKLRPRKDLVETLLHEMIHAYLFVTHNNKDRDGHGPEFHKHMNRINTEAGTSISVYHSFHDEVKLYQKHWWRCDGPCQKRNPYFGIVRRATNRAPSHNDRWWAEHSRSCGGTFIKIKEPEKVEKTKKPEKENSKHSTKNTTDIRSFLPNNNTINASTKTSNNTNSAQIHNTKSQNNIIIINDNPTGSAANISKLHNNTKTNNIRTIYSAPTSTITKRETDFRNNGITSNIKTINSKPSISSTRMPEIETSNITKKTNINQDSYANVREHWLKKFSENASEKKIVKRISEPIVEETHKKTKINTGEVIKITINCPVCDKKFSERELNTHLDLCLNQQPKDHGIHNISIHDNDSFEFPTNSEIINSNQSVIEIEDENTSQIDRVHDFLKTCENFDTLANIDTTISQKSKIETVNLIDKIIMVDCPSCDTKIIEEQLNTHLDMCLISKTKNIGYEMCFICDKNVPKIVYASHVKQCIDLSNFDNTKECDICNEQISELYILSHVKTCIQNISSSST